MPSPRPPLFIGSSRKDLQDLPASIRFEFGSQLYAVQLGGMPASTKPLKGFQPKVYEIVVDGAEA